MSSILSTICAAATMGDRMQYTEIQQPMMPTRRRMNVIAAASARKNAMNSSSVIFSSLKRCMVESPASHIHDASGFQSSQAVPVHWAIPLASLRLVFDTDARTQPYAMSSERDSPHSHEC